MMWHGEAYQENELEQAIREGRAIDVQMFLEQNPALRVSINAMNDTVLHYAVRCDQLSVVEQCSEIYPEMIGAKNYEQETPCSLAVSCGHKNIVVFFIEQHPGLIDVPVVSHSCSKNQTPVHKAACLGHSDIVAYLLEKKPELIHSLDESNRTLLMNAVESCNVETAQLILKKNPASLWIWIPMGGESHAEASFSELPIHLAVHHQDPAMIAMLLQWDPELINVRPSGRQKDTILHDAAYLCYDEKVISALLNISMDHLNAEDECGETPLHHAVRGDGLPEVVACLIRHGAQVNVKDFNGNTPLHCAVTIDLAELDYDGFDFEECCANKKRFVQLLVEAGADPSMQNRDGKTAFDLAVPELKQVIPECVENRSASAHFHRRGNTTVERMVAMGQQQAEEARLHDLHEQGTHQLVLYRPEATESVLAHGTEPQKSRKRKDQPDAESAAVDGFSPTSEKRLRHQP